MDTIEKIMEHNKKVDTVFNQLRDADGLANYIGLIESLNEKEAQDIIKKFVYEYVGLRKTYKWD